ncbi:MAG TPA: class I SAM-dependent methyltransferase [Acetobacteraceae bacterium]|nr:class I SAM-dependent methyltransferase [Acetobacteraceae bacterium]
MGPGRGILMRMFGHPTGLAGRLGGMVLARANYRTAVWTIGLLDIHSSDEVLEIGFGPGVAIRLLAGAARHVAGADPSPEMMRQAARRNAAAISAGHVELHQVSAEFMPFADQTFDKALAINSMQLWPDAAAGLREVRRTLRPGGRLALTFTTDSRRGREGLRELLEDAGFADQQFAETEKAFCVTAARS